MFFLCCTKSVFSNAQRKELHQCLESISTYYPGTKECGILRRSSADQEFLVALSDTQSMPIALLHDLSDAAGDLCETLSQTSLSVIHIRGAERILSLHVIDEDHLLAYSTPLPSISAERFDTAAADIEMAPVLGRLATVLDMV